MATAKTKTETDGVVLGYTLQNAAPDEYIVTITDRRPQAFIDAQNSGVVKRNSKYKNNKVVVIRALLQEDIDVKTSSEWSQMTAARFATTMGNELTNALAGKSLVSKWASRQIWTGVSPVNIRLNLKFEAISDTNLEVIEPIKELHRMSLPYSSLGGELGDILLLNPPGPLATGGIRAAVHNDPTLRGELISIKIGKLMKFNRVVIKDIDYKFANKFEKGGNSIRGSVSVHMQTFEVLTKQSLDEEVFGAPEANVQSLKEQTVDTLKSTGNAFVDKVLNFDPFGINK